MRNLTIKRNKTFAGCLGTLKVYIEDPAAGDTDINGVACRKLGNIKNGEEKIFEICEDAVKVYVIADQLSKSYCNEFYQLCQGQEDVYLSGKCHLNPAAGNPFRFDGNEGAEVLANRKKGTAKGAVITIIAIIVGAIAGALIGSALFGGLHFVKDKEFSESGMTITLTNEFKETQMQNYTVAYKSRDVMVIALKESFDLIPGFEYYTLTNYLHEVLLANNLGDSAIISSDGLVGFAYNATDPTTNQEYRYYNYVYRADDAFWLIQFVTTTKDAQKYEKSILDWAKSVEFAK